jgi:hypothetical protein
MKAVHNILMQHCVLLQVQEYKDSLKSKVSECLACHMRPANALLPA